MKNLILLICLLPFIIACEKSPDKLNSLITARVVRFDLNCSTCILEFPDDSIEVNEEIGKSQYNYYQAINLTQDKFFIGQMLKVKISKPPIEEVHACKTLGPTIEYKQILITDYENFKNLTLNDTVNLYYRDCLNYSENQFYICLDSILNDSRCPDGVYCIWAGNAEVRFKYESYSGNSIRFSLNTINNFTNDTIIDGYKFTLVTLNPYPAIDHRIKQSEYVAKLLVTKN